MKTNDLINNNVFSSFPEVTTPRLFLRPAKLSDADALYALRSDPELMRYMDRPLMKSVDDAVAMIENIFKGYENKTHIEWTIEWRATGEYIGNVGYYRLIRDHGRAEIGYILSPKFWRKGIMSEAMSEVIKIGFSQMELHSIEANINPANKASGKLLEKAGFIHEGHFEESYYYNGTFLDADIYSLLERNHFPY